MAAYSSHHSPTLMNYVKRMIVRFFGRGWGIEVIQAIDGRGLRIAVLAVLLGSLLSVPIAAAQQRPALKEGLEAAAIRKYKTELRNIQELARRGDPNGFFHLGLMHYKGWGVPQDYAEAMRLFNLAAEKGHPQALIWLGDAYAEGKGVPKDYVEAVKYYYLARPGRANWSFRVFIAIWLTKRKGIWLQG
ncbi:MAG: tetratricopeptide repeat protein [Rhodoplanes sp.]